MRAGSPLHSSKHWNSRFRRVPQDHLGFSTPEHNLLDLLQALRESRHHSAQQQSLDKQLRECVYNIRNKEDLIAALNRNDLQAKQLSQQYLVSATAYTWCTADESFHVVTPPQGVQGFHVGDCNHTLHPAPFYIL